MIDRDVLWAWLRGEVPDEAEVDLGDEDFHCAACNRYLSVDDGIVGVQAPGSLPWASDWWRIDTLTGLMAENRIAFLGCAVGHTICREEFLVDYDEHTGDFGHQHPE